MGLFDKFKKNKNIEESVSIDIETEEKEIVLDRASSMATYPKKFENNLSKDSIIEKISKSDEIELLSISEYLEEIDGFSADFKYLDTEYKDVLIKDANFDELDYMEDIKKYNTRPLIDGEIEGAQKLKYSIYTNVIFNEKPTQDFHFQLKLLYLLSGDCYLLQDVSGDQYFSGEWLKISAKSKITPSPDSMYKIDAVVDNENGERKIWLHTHGLNRMGIVELDILEVTKYPEQQYEFLNYLAKFMMDSSEEIKNYKVIEPAKDTKVILLDYDRGIDIVAKLSNKVKETILGGISDRDDYHTGNRSIVFVVDSNNKYQLTNYIADNLANNPLLWVSSIETKRMSEKAKETFEYFKSIYLEKSKIEDWEFLIKVAYQMDGTNPEDNENEHLWFSVESVGAESNDNKLVAKLLNKPYYVKALKEDKSYTINMDNLTDWLIYTPKIRFDTENIFIYPSIYLNTGQIS